MATKAKRAKAKSNCEIAASSLGKCSWKKAVEKGDAKKRIKKMVAGKKAKAKKAPKKRK